VEAEGTEAAPPAAAEAAPEAHIDPEVIARAAASARASSAVLEADRAAADIGEVARDPAAAPDLVIVRAALVATVAVASDGPGAIAVVQAVRAAVVTAGTDRGPVDPEVADPTADRVSPDETRASSGVRRTTIARVTRRSRAIRSSARTSPERSRRKILPQSQQKMKPFPDVSCSCGWPRPMNRRGNLRSEEYLKPDVGSPGRTRRRLQEGEACLTP
jgi:hypothetical protein